MGEILEELARSGPAATSELSASLRERQEVRVALDDAGDRDRRGRSVDIEAMVRELAMLGWVDLQEGRWALTPAGEERARSNPVKDATSFALTLCVAHERKNQQVVSRLLARLWDLNPERQGAVVFVLPRITEPPPDRTSLEQWLAAQSPSWLAALTAQTSGLNISASTEDITRRIAGSLQEKWDALGPRGRRKRLEEVLTDQLFDLLFGSIVAPRDFRVWQSRMDWAGLTLLARSLPGVRGRVWFPVGAFRRSGNPSFRPIDGVSRDGSTYHVHVPTGAEAERRFADALHDAYRRLQRHERVEYVSLLTVRDRVCYALRIGNACFEELLQRVFPRALQGELPYAMALEVDLSPSDRRNLRGRLPVTIDHIPRYILSMRRR